MADLLTPSSVTMTTINAAAEKPEKAGGSDKVPQPKPERPDEEKYKEALAKAEKEHAIAQDKFVRRIHVQYASVQHRSFFHLCTPKC